MTTWITKEQARRLHHLAASPYNLVDEYCIRRDASDFEYYWRSAMETGGSCPLFTARQGTKVCMKKVGAVHRAFIYGYSNTGADVKETLASLEQT